MQRVLHNMLVLGTARTSRPQTSGVLSNAAKTVNPFVTRNRITYGIVSRPTSILWITCIEHIMPNSMPGIIVICVVGAAPRGRPILGIKNGRAQGPAPTG